MEKKIKNLGFFSLIFLFIVLIPGIVWGKKSGSSGNPKTYNTPISLNYTSKQKTSSNSSYNGSTMVQASQSFKFKKSVTSANETKKGFEKETEKLDKLLYDYFIDEDYEEIIGLLRNKPFKELNYKEAYYLGYSYLMLGELDKALTCLKISYEKVPELNFKLKIAEALSTIHFYKKEYKEILDLLKPLPFSKLSEKSKYYYVIALINLKKFKEGEILAEKINNPKLRKKVKQLIKRFYKTFVIVNILGSYDSNVKLLNDNLTNSSAFLLKSSLIWISDSPYRTWNFIIVENYYINREFKNFDLYLLKLGVTEKFENFGVAQSFTGIYTNNEFYKLTYELKIFNKFFNRFKLGIMGKVEKYPSELFSNKDAVVYGIFGSLNINWSIFQRFSFKITQKNYLDYQKLFNLTSFINATGFTNPQTYKNKRVFSGSLYIKWFNWKKLTLTSPCDISYVNYFEKKENYLNLKGGANLNIKLNKVFNIPVNFQVIKNRALTDNAILENEYFKWSIEGGVKLVF